MTDDIAISVRNLTKSYRLFNHPGDRVKQFLSLGFKQYHRKFTALDDVSFDIKKGETVGIIGQNGSGKSTLLQLICGILKPTSGTIKTSGRISALLELGAGFNPEFTGRENVYFQGALMGISLKEMQGRFDEIVDFANIGEFIDQPVRTYSSGMFVRLAFAVSIHVTPEVLIVDEALGVGDAEFQERSISRMKTMKKNGTTILFVTHSISAIRSFCERVVWLDTGVIRKIGLSSETCLAYEKHIGRCLEIGAGKIEAQQSFSKKKLASRTKIISIVEAEIENNRIVIGESLNLNFRLAFSDDFEPTTQFGLGVIIYNEQGRLITLFNTIRDDIVLTGKITKLSLHLAQTSFTPGHYWISVNVCDIDILFPYDEANYCLSFEVPIEINQHGIPRWGGEIACKHDWLR